MTVHVDAATDHEVYNVGDSIRSIPAKRQSNQNNPGKEILPWP